MSHPLNNALFVCLFVCLFFFCSRCCSTRYIASRTVETVSSIPAPAATAAPPAAVTKKVPGSTVSVTSELVSGPLVDVGFVDIFPTFDVLVRTE